MCDIPSQMQVICHAAWFTDDQQPSGSLLSHVAYQAPSGASNKVFALLPWQISKYVKDPLYILLIP